MVNAISRCRAISSVSLSEERLHRAMEPGAKEIKIVTNSGSLCRPWSCADSVREAGLERIVARAPAASMPRCFGVTGTCDGGSVGCLPLYSLVDYLRATN